MYIRLQAYVYIYQCIYIYTRSPSLDTLCPIRLSLKPCWLFPPRGFLHLPFSISSKIKNSNRSASHVLQEKHVAKMTVISLAQKKRSPFFQLAHWGERSWSSCRSINGRGRLTNSCLYWFLWLSNPVKECRLPTNQYKWCEGGTKKGGCCHTTFKAGERKGLRHSKIYSLVLHYTRSTGW